MIELSREEDVYTLTMNAGENRWNTTFVREFAAALDEVEASTGAAALVTASASEKFFSNGLDLDWVAAPDAHPEAGDRGAFGAEFMALMGRIITFPVPTVCAINGHAFGAGFMAALCHDVRIMRSDRGFVCANEMQLGMKIPDQELALFRHKLPRHVFFETVQLARRWTGPEALAAGIVSETGELDGLLASAQRRAAALAPLGANRELYGGQKETLFGENAVINGPHGPAYLLRTAGDH
jgi:enoyl-CoA hydratase/carnithine racemase